MLRNWRPFRRRLNVFISYSHHDSEFVSPIVRLLAALRNDVFVDTASIEIGAEWARAIEEAIRMADVVVVFWCTHSSRSSWVQSECELARSLNKSLMPLLLDDTALSSDLRGLQALDFRSLETHTQKTTFNSGPFNERQARVIGAFIVLGWLAWYLFSFADELWMRMPQPARSALLFVLMFVVVLSARRLKRGLALMFAFLNTLLREFHSVERRIAIEVCDRLDQIRAQNAPV